MQSHVLLEYSDASHFTYTSYRHGLLTPSRVKLLNYLRFLSATFSDTHSKKLITLGRKKQTLFKLHKHPSSRNPNQRRPPRVLTGQPQRIGPDRQAGRRNHPLSQDSLSLGLTFVKALCGDNFSLSLSAWRVEGFGERLFN